MYFLKPQLGELEIKILEIFWENPTTWDVKSMHSVICNNHSVNLNTVQSAMERLFKKGFLGREKISHAYIYSCIKTREDFVSETMQTFMREMNVDEDTFISAFISATSRRSKNNLDDLVTKLKNAWDNFRGKN